MQLERDAFLYKGGIKMASHAGLVYVLKTKYGYVNEKGKFVDNIEEAQQIDFMRFGFGPSAYEVYQRLGYKNELLKKEDICFHTVVPSYDSRLGIIEDFYQLIGYDYWTSCMIAAEDFKRYNLYCYQNFQDYEKVMHKKVLEFYKTREKSLSINGIDLYAIPNKKPYLKEEGTVECFYSKLGKIYCYSIPLKNPHMERYFNVYQNGNQIQNMGLLEYMKQKLVAKEKSNQIYGIIQDESLKIYMQNPDSKMITYSNECIRDYYNEHEMHITRMFGSYILLGKEDGKLKARKATPIPIQYCPLMVKLLKEVGGDYASTLLETLHTEDIELQTKMMCHLIDEIVIKNGYFDTGRPLNSCEANVLFGASETMSSAFQEGMIDAAVIVSNNLGTIITTNASNTQGAVKRMTGLFYTSPSREIMETAKEAGIIPVYPYTATINQLEGVKKAIRLGYKNIAVSVAASDNILHEALKELEKNGITIYKFGLCSTGIDSKTATIMGKNADVIWTCASKNVKEFVEPNAIAQIGIKIPVHVMTEKGFQIVRSHLMRMGFDENEIKLTKGEAKPVFINEKGKIKVLQKRMLHRCVDCPQPCA